MKKEIKTITISPKIKKSSKDLLVFASQKEMRSQANMLEIMILEYCNKHDLIKVNNDSK